MADLVRDQSNISAWGFNENATVVLVSDTCPFFPGDPVYENRLVDGQRPSWDPTSNERSDLQDGNVARDVERGYEIGLKMISFPSNQASAQSWWLIMDPIEVHGVTLNQAVIQPQCLVSAGPGTQGTSTPRRNDAFGTAEPRLFMDANAGRGPHRYFDMGPAVLNEWTYLRMHFILGTSTSNFIRIYRDGDTTPRVSITDATSIESSGGYYKGPNYSNAGLNGLRAYRWSGAREWNGLPTSRWDGGGPPPDNTPEPITGLMAQAGDQQVSLSWTNPTTGPAIDEVFIKRSTVSFPQQYTDGTLVMSDITAPLATSYVDTGLNNGVIYYYSVFTRHYDGSTYWYSDPVQVSSTPQPPPPPPPDPPETNRPVRSSGIVRGENHRGELVR